MFLYWYEHGRNVLKTAGKFKLAESTMRSVLARNHWKERADAIDVKISRVVDKTIEQRGVSELQDLMQCRDKAVRAYLAKPDELILEDLKDIASVTELLVKIRGLMPQEGQPADVVNIYNDIATGELLKRIETDLATIAKHAEGTLAPSVELPSRFETPVIRP